MQKFHLDDGDGYISRAEYILLCAVRLELLSRSMIKMMNKNFNKNDTNNSGQIAYKELNSGKFSMISKNSIFFKTSSRYNFSRFSSVNTSVLKNHNEDTSRIVDFDDEDSVLDDNDNDHDDDNDDDDDQFNGDYDDDDISLEAANREVVINTTMNPDEGVSDIDKNNEKRHSIIYIIASKIYSYLIYFKFPCFILLWLVVGTIFYGNQKYCNYSYAYGFYNSMNIGFAIGFSDPEVKGLTSEIFSFFYLLTGISLITGIFTHYLKSMVSDSKHWYDNMMKEETKKIRHNTNNNNITDSILAWLSLNQIMFKAILLWILWMSSLTLFAIYRLKYVSLLEAVIFAISVMSTIGLYGLPPDSLDNDFVIVGLLGCTGIPLTLFTMTTIAITFLPKMMNRAQIKMIINADLGNRELVMMQKFHLDDGDGYISRAEYILLCAVRLELLTRPLIKMINEKFNEIDHIKSGLIAYEQFSVDLRNEG